MRAAAGSPLVQLRRRNRRRARILRRSVAGLVLLALAGVVLGLAFAGSPGRVPAGVRIAGVAVGGLSAADATQLLERRARALAHAPVVFTAAGRRWKLTPAQLELRVDWKAAVTIARRQGDGFAPLRGFRRLGMRVFGADVSPPTRVYGAALAYELDQISGGVNRRPLDASLVRRGLQARIVRGQAGRGLDRAAAAGVIVRALAGFSRRPVALPLRLARPAVTAAELAPAAVIARRALSRPIRLSLRGATWALPRWRLAQLLVLPQGGERRVRIGGPAANRYFAGLSQAVDRPAREADFAVTADGRVRVLPSQAGRSLDAEKTARNMLTAAGALRNRVARVAVVPKLPRLTTERAQAMGITGLVGGYETIYGGDPNRVHNVQLVAQLLDKHLIAPGATFSFNRTTGARTAERGFREAPVIINGELETGLGGGVCQVSTTVFNAAYEAGLDITARTNHALYISHYPLGRDATVDYPSIDLQFVNDTPHWLLLRTFVGSASLVVNLYGTPVHRRVVTETSPLVETGAAPVRRSKDPTLRRGATVVDESGEPSRSTSAHRLVYAASGRLLHDDTWHSSYRAEPRIVRIGAKPKAKPNAKSKAKRPPKDTGLAPPSPAGHPF